MAKILIVEDNQDLANLVRSMLEFEDHTVHAFHTGIEGRDNILKQPYDLVILDWDLPGCSGIEILKAFRDQGGTTPVVMLTGRQSVEEKEAGLDEGADDYLTKPFDMKELSARVRAQLRRSAKAASTTTLQIGDIVLDPTKQRATRAGRTIVLTPREYQLLEFSAKYPHLVLQTAELIAQVWPSDSEVDEEVVKTTVRRLRKKLDPEAKIICPHLYTQAEGQSAGGLAGADSAATAGQAGFEGQPEEESDPFLGTVFDEKYELLHLLGGGGTGIVYRAKHCVIGNIVAVKLLYPHMSLQPDIVRRFSQEARATGLLSHKNVIAIHDFGQNDMGQPYLVMELIDGASLSDLIGACGRIPIELTAEIFVQACDGLAHAHEKGVFHRDVKPSNLMLIKNSDDSYTVKVVDFGLAKPSNENSDVDSLTRTGEVFGSPPYMSPEQCRGQRVDHRADIYALGCVLYEMLTGTPPFVGSDAIQTILKHVNSEPPRLFLNAIPDKTNMLLDKTIQKCLAKDRDARYQTVDELRTAFKSIFP